MQKYFLIAKNTWDEATTYRVSFVIWRLRNMFSLLTVYFLWIAVIPAQGVFAGYGQEQMITYIVGTAIISSFVMATRTQEIGNHINEGILSNFLLKPMPYLVYFFARDVGDKALNTVFAFGEVTLFLLLFRPDIFLQRDVTRVIVTFLAIVLGTVLFFYFNVLIGLFGFWSNEIWGLRFIFSQVLSFAVGGYFPLDILPKPLFLLLSYLPFPYLQFFPLKIYLGHIPHAEIVKGLLITLGWIAIMHKLTMLVWQKGLRVYTAQGR